MPSKQKLKGRRRRRWRCWSPARCSLGSWQCAVGGWQGAPAGPRRFARRPSFGGAPQDEHVRVEFADAPPAPLKTSTRTVLTYCCSAAVGQDTWGLGPLDGYGRTASLVNGTANRQLPTANPSRHLPTANRQPPTAFTASGAPPAAR